MTEARTHYIADIYAIDEKIDRTSLPAVSSMIPHQPIINEIPPPRRTLFLSVFSTNYNNAPSVGLERVYGFIFHKNVCLNNSDIKNELLTSVDGLVTRTIKQNETAKYHGIRIAAFLPECGFDIQHSVYVVFDSVCRKYEHPVKVTCDILDCEDDIRSFLKSQCLRIKIGDTAYQYEEFA